MSKIISKITTSQFIIENDDVSNDLIRLIDVTNSANFVAIGEVRIQDPNNELTDKIAIDDTVTIDMGFIEDGERFTETIFSGTIQQFDGANLKVIRLKGLGDTLRTTNFKRNYRVIEAERILKDILRAGNITNFEIGSIPRVRRHSYIARNGTLLENINQLNNSFGLDLIPYVNEAGKFLFKKLEELRRTTSIIFESDTFTRFNNNQLEANFDPEIKVFDEITILDELYLTTENNIISDVNKTKSIITATKV